MKTYTSQQLSLLSPCEFDMVLSAANRKFKYFQAAEAPQYSREEEEREQFAEFYTRVLREKRRRKI